MPNNQIATELGVANSAITNYMAGRIPAADILELISQKTKCSIHWLVTGEGEQYLQPTATADESAKKEEEFEGLFFDYKTLTAEDKEELRGLMAYVDHEIKKVKRKREQRNLTTDKAGLE